MIIQPTLFQDQPDIEIWRILQHHKGRDNAIRMPILANMVNQSTRTVQQIIERFIRQGRPIGSSCGRKPGYYIITNQEDFELTFRNRVNRGISNLVAAYALKKNPILERALGQLKAL